MSFVRGTLLALGVLAACSGTSLLAQTISETLVCKSGNKTLSIPLQSFYADYTSAATNYFSIQTDLSHYASLFLEVDSTSVYVCSVLPGTYPNAVFDTATLVDASVTAGTSGMFVTATFAYEYLVFESTDVADRIATKAGKVLTPEQKADLAAFQAKLPWLHGGSDTSKASNK